VSLVCHKSQANLLQQLETNFSKSIEKCIKPFIDNLSKQLHATQLLNENIGENVSTSQCDSTGNSTESQKMQGQIKQLQQEIVSLQSEKYQSAVEISKLQSQLDSEKIRSQSAINKLEMSMKLLNDDNEGLRERQKEHKNAYEKLMSDHKILQEKYNSQFDEILNLKSQLSSSFNRDESSSDGPVTSRN